MLVRLCKVKKDNGFWDSCSGLLITRSLQEIYKKVTRISDKNMQSIWWIQKKWLPLHPMMCHKTAGGSSSGAHWKQFIAERGIEYGFQFVTPKILNSPDSLYLKKSCKFLQSYEKSSTEQKILFFFMPRRSNFANFIGNVTKKREKCKFFG